MTLTRSVFRATQWSAFSQATRQAAQLVVTVILARLLSPDDFGVIAMASVVTGFVILLSDLGTSAAVIQRAEHSPRFLSAVFWVNLAFGLILMVTVAASSPLIARFYREPRLISVLLACAALMAQWFGLRRRVERSSTLGIEGRRSERLVKLCRYFGATKYVSGDAAKDYLDLALFTQHGIQVEWQQYVHPAYPQLHGEFVPYLSALDLLFNCGDEAPLIAFGGMHYSERLT